MEGDWTPQQLDHVRGLVATGTYSAQLINDKIFNSPESVFRGWSNESLAVATACLAAGFARGVQFPKGDFLLLCETAFDLIRSEEKTK